MVFEPAKEFIAYCGNQYRKLSNITMSQFIDETPRYNGQMSIQEVNYQWAVALLTAQHTIILELNASEADKDTPTLMGEDQRQIVERQIKQRSGQKTFRDQLLKSNPTCAVMGCKLVYILDAAHINVYRNDSHNHISNGLLLRSDIHTLYDLNLCAINPITKTIHFSVEALENGYSKFEGLKINTQHNIAIKPLLTRWQLLKFQNSIDI
ncbi:HNH endonuclease [Escherichia coli]|nr:HNH endonuclease [Escherichia coli]